MAGTKKNTKLWRIWSMFLKEIRLIQNDRYALLLIFVLPAMIMGTMWLALEQRNLAPPANSEGKSEDALIIGLVDDDPTHTYPGQDLSENFTWYLQNSPDFIITMYDTEEEALLALYQDSVDAYAIIPYGFEGNITNNIPSFVEVHISSTDFDSQAAVFSAFNDVVVQFRIDHGWINHEVRMNQVREWEPTGNYFAATFGVFLLVFSIFIATSATAAQAIVGDVPLSRMLLTPATKMEAIIAKVIGYFIVGMIQAQFILVLWMGLFGIVPNTDYLTLNIILALMSFSGSSLGVFISTIVTTRLQANQSFLFLLFSSFIVGTGFMEVGVIDEYWPLNLGRVMIFDTAFKGVDIMTFSTEITRILAVSIGLMIFAWIVFSKRKSLA
ncbi:MAG: ABC transporter permease [Candidatus Thorarchaeota archaeon]